MIRIKPPPHPSPYANENRSHANYPLFFSFSTESNRIQPVLKSGKNEEEEISNKNNHDSSNEKKENRINEKKKEKKLGAKRCNTPETKHRCG